MVTRTMLARIWGCHTNNQLVAGFTIDLDMWQNCNTNNWLLISANKCAFVSMSTCVNCLLCILYAHSVL